MGLPASPGAAVGQIVFSADDAEAWHSQGKSVILVCLYVISIIFTFALSTYIVYISLLFRLSGSLILFQSLKLQFHGAI